MERWKSEVGGVGGKSQRREENKKEDQRRERVRGQKMQVREKVEKLVEKHTNSPCRTFFAGICTGIYAREASIRMPAVHGLYSFDKWEHKLYTNALTFSVEHSDSLAMPLGQAVDSFYSPQVLFVSCSPFFPNVVMIYICCSFYRHSIRCFSQL